MTPKKAKKPAKKAERGRKLPAKKSVRGARKVASAESAPVAPPPVPPATPDDTPAPAYRPFVQLGDLAPLALFEVGLAIGKVEMFCAANYYRDHSSALLDNLAMELGVLGGCLESLRQYVPFENPFRKIIHAAHKQLESITNIERPEFANRHFSALDNVVAKLRRLECESLLFNFGRMIGHVAHDGFNSRHSNKDYNVTAEVLREAIKGAAIPSLVMATEPILDRMEEGIQQLPDSELEDVVRRVLESEGVVQGVPSPPSDDHGPRYVVTVQNFPARGKNPIRDKIKVAVRRVEGDGIDDRETMHQPTANAFLRFLVILGASRGGGQFLFGDDVKMQRDGSSCEVPGKALFLDKAGSVVSNMSVAVDRTICSVLFGSNKTKLFRAELRGVLGGARRTQVDDLLPAKLQRVDVVFADGVIASMEKYCHETAKWEEETLQEILRLASST